MQTGSKLCHIGTDKDHGLNQSTKSSEGQLSSMLLILSAQYLIETVNNVPRGREKMTTQKIFMQRQRFLTQWVTTEVHRHTV